MSLGKQYLLHGATQKQPRLMAICHEYHLVLMLNLVSDTQYPGGRGWNCGGLVSLTYDDA